MTIALGVDPSLSCTAWAIVKEDVGLRVIAAGKIVVEPEKDVWKRVNRICQRLYADVMTNANECPADIAAVEMPMTAMFRRGEQQRSATTLPGYGVCVGAVAMMVRSWMPANAFLAPSATDWARGLPKADERKGGRIRQVGYLFNYDVDTQHGRTHAGDIADAILLGRWALDRHRLESRVGA